MSAKSASVTERIVVGVDERRASVAAVEWVAQRCARKSASVDLITVDAVMASRRDSMTLLEEAERIIRGRVPGQDVRVRQSQGGVASILAESSATADLLVIGVDPDHPVRAAFGGWIPVRVTSRARVPVCVVPVGWSGAGGCVTVGLADDDSSRQALVFAAREALDNEAQLRVVHAWRLPDPFLDGTAAIFEQPEHVHERQRARLESSVRWLRARFRSLDVVSELARTSPSQLLLNRADSSALIVIGTHGEGVLAGGLSSAVGQDIFWKTRTPVCVVTTGWRGLGKDENN